MKIYIYFILFFLPSVILICFPKYHFWQPYPGYIPEFAFLGTHDTTCMDKKYIAKITTKDLKSWVLPAELSNDYVVFTWENGQPQRIDEFIEVMSTWSYNKNHLEWVLIDDEKDMDHIFNECCLVEAGIVKYKTEVILTHIGRKVKNHTVFIGEAHLQKNSFFERGIHYMDGWNKIVNTGNFEVLTYFCRAPWPKHCKPKPDGSLPGGCMQDRG